jgi:lysine-specific demethylase 8
MICKNNNSILRIKKPIKKEFVEIWNQYQPFLVEGVVEYWDACKKWSNDYLIKHCGNNIVNINLYKKGFFDDYKNFACEDGYIDEKFKKTVQYKEYVSNYIENNSHSYDYSQSYLSEDLEKCFPEILGDITYPTYLDRKPFVQFFHGFSNKVFSSTTPLHFDPVHNIFNQIRGRKKILLFPPSDYLSFYPAAVDDNRGLQDFSKVDPNLPNLELFPKFPWQDRIEVLLQPGEMLYIPPFWWHHVTAVDENISVSFWYALKIQDIFKQKKILSVLSDLLPHSFRSSIYSRNTLLETLAFITNLFIGRLSIN